MTRKTLFRHLLALEMLNIGNVRAYWYALPKGSKRSLEWVYWWRQYHVLKMFRKQWDHAVAIRAAFQANAIAPMAERDFQLPWRLA